MTLQLSQFPIQIGRNTVINKDTYTALEVLLSHGNPRKGKNAYEQLSLSSPTIFQTYTTNPIYGLRHWLSFVLVITIQLFHVLVLVDFKSFGVVFSQLVLKTQMEF